MENEVNNTDTSTLVQAEPAKKSNLLTILIIIVFSFIAVTIIFAVAIHFINIENNANQTIGNNNDNNSQPSLVSSGQTCVQKNGQICPKTTHYCHGNFVNASDINDTDDCCLGTCESIKDLSNKTCEQFQGQICPSGTVCFGITGKASNTNNCCFGYCNSTQDSSSKTCLDMQGIICSSGKRCIGDTVVASDTDNCCTGGCLGWP